MISSSLSAESSRLRAGHAAALAAVLLAGCGLAGALVVIKLRLLFDPGFVSSCNLSEMLDCDVVQTSPYSTVFGRPLALFGFATYVYLLVLVWLARASCRLGTVFLFVLALSGVAICLHSLYLAFVSTFVIGAYCVYCMGMYAVNLLVTGLAVDALRRDGGIRSAMSVVLQRPAGLMSGAAASALVYAGALGGAIPAYGALRADYKERRIEAARAELSKFVRNVGRSYYEVPITDHDFVLGPADAPVTVVEFADFECPFCFEFYQNSKKLRRKYAGTVRWVFKHFPMNSACNERVKEEFHPEACNAARAASCAGEQGKFWPMHDRLFENQYELDEESLRRHAAAVGVDSSVWDACYAREGPDPITAAHTEQARFAGIVQTPTSYINGHLVPGAPAAEVLEYYFRAALEHPWDPAPELVPLARAGTTIELRMGDHVFYIDAYEASLDAAGRAQSAPGVRPAAVSWFEADRTCRAAGKRLCSAEEWIAACTGRARRAVGRASGGTRGEIMPRTFPYGYFHQAGICHDDEPASGGQARPTGSFSRCRTPEGVYDLSGNLAEWIGLDATSAAVVSSDFHSGLEPACLAPQTREGEPRFRDDTTGFRCCAD